MASLGGLLVTNTSGVKRTRYGTVRDLLLGVRVALPDGALVRFGGRVVKNVAGYDMNKLFIGSLGVFGVVLETTYRLAALPEDDRGLVVVFPSLSQAMAAAAAIQGSPLLPSMLTLCNARAAEACVALQALSLQPLQVALCLDFDGMHEAVERQLRDSRALCQQHGGRADAVLTADRLLSLWEFQEAWRTAPAAPARLQVRLGVGASRVEEALRALAVPPSVDLHGVGWLADAASGQIWLHLPLAQPVPAQLHQEVASWLLQQRRQARDWHGYCVVEYAPITLRPQLDVWGETPGQQLLRLYKQRFDPQAVLNPGRYVADL
jgi:glycolate oxidase FAD binding subunit